LIRDATDDLAWEAVRLAVEAGDDVKVVLLQDAVAAGIPPAGAEIFLQADEAPARAASGATGLSPLDYDGIVELISWADKVVAW